MICKIENCNKEAKNLLKVIEGGITFEFQLCDEHFPSNIPSYNLEPIQSLRSSMIKELNRLKSINLDKDFDKKLKEFEKKRKKLDKKGSEKENPEDVPEGEQQVISAKNQRKILMKKLKKLLEEQNEIR